MLTEIITTTPEPEESGCCDFFAPDCSCKYQ